MNGRGFRSVAGPDSDAQVQENLAYVKIDMAGPVTERFAQK